MRGLPNDVNISCAQLLQEHIRNSLKIQSFESLGGGCINNGGKLITDSGMFFVKWNLNQKFPNMFMREAEGLKLLGDSKSVRVPEVIGYGTGGDYQFLILEFIDERRRVSDFWSAFAHSLATMHRHTAEQYGLLKSNYMGSLVQTNTYKSNWTEFFIEERLEPQLRIAGSKIDSGIHRKFAALYKRLPDLLIIEPPTLVHGDLWNGNLISDENGLPCLIDPAVYYGNREVDLAMTTLFGGFDQAFYSLYQEIFPVEPGLPERLDVYNLYPLLVHVNLFGGGYLAQVLNIVDRYQ